MAIGPQSSPSNFLVFDPDICIKVWPHAIPESEKDKKKDESEEVPPGGPANEEQGAPGVVVLPSHAGLFRRI